MQSETHCSSCRNNVTSDDGTSHFTCRSTCFSIHTIKGLRSNHITLIIESTSDFTTNLSSTIDTQHRTSFISIS